MEKGPQRACRVGDTEFLDPQGLREKGAMREGCPQASLGDSTL